MAAHHDAGWLPAERVRTSVTPSGLPRHTTDRTGVYDELPARTRSTEAAERRRGGAERGGGGGGAAGGSGARRRAAQTPVTDFLVLAFSCPASGSRCRGGEGDILGLQGRNVSLLQLWWPSRRIRPAAERRTPCRRRRSPGSGSPLGLRDRRDDVRELTLISAETLVAPGRRRCRLTVASGNRSKTVAHERQTDSPPRAADQAVRVRTHPWIQRLDLACSAERLASGCGSRLHLTRHGGLTVAQRSKPAQSSSCPVPVRLGLSVARCRLEVSATASASQGDSAVPALLTDADPARRPRPRDPCQEF